VVSCSTLNSLTARPVHPTSPPCVAAARLRHSRASARRWHASLCGGGTTRPNETVSMRWMSGFLHSASLLSVQARKQKFEQETGSFRCGRYPPPVPFALHFFPLRPPSASPVETSAKRLGALGCLSLGFQERSLRLSLQATFFGAVGIIATEVALHWRPAPAGWRAAVAGYLISPGITAPLGSARPNIKRCLC
jgi:hypothetical protein